MQELINLIVTTGVGLAILGSSYLLDLIVGAIKVLFAEHIPWSWKKMGEDLLKAILLALSTEAWVVLWYIAGWYASKVGLDISQFTNAMSISGMIGAIGIGSFWYLSNAGTNLLDFLNTKHVQVNVDEASADYAAVTDMVTSLAGVFTKHDDDTSNIVSVDPELGASCYYKVDVSTPGSFYNAVNGKGFNEGFGYQCVAGFKEFQFSLAGTYVSAGGAAKNYAYTHSAVEALGFTWHDGNTGFQNGDWAIWTDGAYGHVAMYYNGKWFGQNQGAKDAGYGTPFNLMSLPTKNIAGFYRPNIYKLPAPTPEPTPEPVKSKFKVGDIVVPTKLVDYDGTPLRQWDDKYVITQISGDRAVLCADRNGELICYAALNTKNIKKV